MKVPLNWLKEYVDVTLPPAELAEKLTLAGFEVVEIQVIGSNWDNVLIGEITAVDPHPNADRLHLATVNLGAEQETVVCGAPNLNVGDKIAFARVGAVLTDPDSGQPAKLKPAKIRGVESKGMICAEKELGISDDYTSIMVLPQEAPPGTPLADFLGETVLDLDITPNRPDCLSVVGIAREVAALTGQKPHIPEISYEETEPPVDQQVSVEIIENDLCPRYTATLITGVKIGESPRWIQERLLACGMRPINNIVDVTNYVMMEYGQPLHSFDYERIRGKKIIVRRARDGEYLETLDGTERTLSSDMLVIADEGRAVALAGVMGGANSEVTEGTTSILLEAASFKPSSIHYTSRNLLLTSEASMRFERGITPGITIPALKHATQLIAEMGGGKIAKGIADVYPGKKEPEPIALSKDKVNRTLALDLTIDRITSALDALGFECKQTAESEVAVTAPYWRSDIKWPVDLVEEVARIIGYDQIPMTLFSEPIPHQNPDPIIKLERKIRQSLTGYGFQEIVTYSLVGMEMLNQLMPELHPPEPMPLRLTNPMTAEQEYLRPHLRANLISALTSNRRHEDGGIKLFELGKVYLPKPNDLPDEPDVLCVVMSGASIEKTWLTEEKPFDFFDARGIAESLFSQAGIAAAFEKSSDEGLHPAKQASIVIDGKQLGIIGELHPKVAADFEIEEPVYLIEIEVTALLPYTAGHRLFQQIPRFPSMARDMALVVDANVTNRQALDIISKFQLVKDVSIFDVYSGKQVAEGKKSLAYRVVFQSPTHTLTDEEVDKVQGKILGRLSHELGATLRS